MAAPSEPSNSEHQLGLSNSKPAPHPALSRHRGMVGWFDPRQLLRTGQDVAVSGLLGVRADFRVLESLTAAQTIFDYKSESELWVDFTADLGDGWDSTFTVASLLASPSLELRAPAGERFTTTRGSILIMGGDEVYPVASQAMYADRTIHPYTCAFPKGDSPRPHLFAIPGNHDWYDGLVSYMRLFCQGRSIGNWQTSQRRSYFALILPHHWWLLGTDIQLDKDIDRPQLDYFETAVKRMQPGDRVILVTAEPHWIYGEIYDPKFEKNLTFIEKQIARRGATVQVVLSGDLHHYRRHEATDGSCRQLIVAGGGGAFLSPTCGPPVDVIEVGTEPESTYKLRAEFPSFQRSRELLRRVLFFPRWNPKFGSVMGLLYLAIAWKVQGPLENRLGDEIETTGLRTTLGVGFHAALTSPGSIALLALLVLGFIAFTNTHKRAYRIIAGSLHSGAHLLGALIVSWTAIRFASLLIGALPPLFLGGEATATTQFWLRAVGYFGGGWVLGSLIMGWYLYLSLRYFRRHTNEAFSALRIPDYKNFLRLHIDRRGRLTIYPIGIEKVPRDWVPGSSPTGPRFIPAAGQELVAHLIEQPIVIPPGREPEERAKQRRAEST